MTQQDIIRMAREAGIGWGEGLGGMPEFLERFAALVAAAEREACAKVCDGLRKKEIAHWNAFGMDGSSYSASDCAAAIRARGQA